ncbi:hypothetical protein ACL7TT_18740 [Microbulbifer sp. 2304DJ12-6]|uniref:hypothetical protein n=1 Tax=Microbulbifer sp. 2304DJ12-6 TaxID=3233340 RepID=UPI0039AF99C7
MSADENGLGASFPKAVADILQAKNVPVSYRSYPEKNIVQHLLNDGRTLKLALPVTFTPYASVKPCSARCQFCSENLRSAGALHGNPPIFTRNQK